MKIALTFDDLPFCEGNLFPGMHLETSSLIIKTLQKHKLYNVCGFMNAFDIKENFFDRICQDWINAGHHLGNHTYSHLNLSEVSPDNFINDVKTLEPIIEKFEQHKYIKYFRYPYLNMGNSELEYQIVKGVLDCNNYQVVDVTIDSKDYIWSSLLRKLVLSGHKDITDLKNLFLQYAVYNLEYIKMLSDLAFARQIKHVMLLHFKHFSSLVLDELISLYKQKGVEFILLDEALKDPVYQQDQFDSYNYSSFIERFCSNKNIYFTDDILQKRKQMLDIIETAEMQFQSKQ